LILKSQKASIYEEAKLKKGERRASNNNVTQSVTTKLYWVKGKKQKTIGISDGDR
jgi:hypothetical protein